MTAGQAGLLLVLAFLSGYCFGVVIEKLWEWYK